jgi:MFS family permease
MTHETDYIDFIVSRLFSGLFGAVPSAVGGSIIFDVFYLHQRGRAFACYESAILLGATIGPTFSGFIAGTTSWTWCFWWTVPLLAVTAILVFWLADETSFDRVQERPRIEKPQSFIRNRIALFAPGKLAVDALPTAEVVGFPVFLSLLR